MSTLKLRGNEKSQFPVNSKAIRAAMQLKGLRPIDLARKLEVSLRAMEYYLAARRSCVGKHNFWRCCSQNWLVSCPPWEAKAQQMAYRKRRRREANMQELRCNEVMNLFQLKSRASVSNYVRNRGWDFKEEPMPQGGRRLITSSRKISFQRTGSRWSGRRRGSVPFFRRASRLRRLCR